MFLVVTILFNTIVSQSTTRECINTTTAATMEGIITTSLNCIDSNAFENNKNITKVIFTGEENLRFIYHCFSGCVNLAAVEVTIQYVKIEALAENSFYNTSLQTFDLRGYNKLPNNCFADSTFLSEITHSNLLSNIGINAFKNTNIEYIEVALNSPITLSNFAFDGCVNFKGFSNEIESFATIGWGAFRGTGIQIFDLRGYQFIPTYAFQNCKKLEYIIGAEQVTQISTSALSGCTNLKALVLGKTLSKVSANAFDNVPENFFIVYNGGQFTCSGLNNNKIKVIVNSTSNCTDFCGIQPLVLDCAEDEIIVLNKTCQKCPMGKVKSVSYNTISCDQWNCNEIENCEENSCGKLSGCRTCISGYYLYDGLCVKCGEGCSKCDQNTCLECDSGKFQSITNTSICIKCADNCVVCDSDTQCRICSFGFYKKSGKCYSCDKNCVSECIDDVGCKTCNTTFYSENGECHQCMSNCLLCSNNTVCESCDTTYFLNDNFTCSKCDTNCVINKCHPSLGCESCVETYFVNSGLCDKCPKHCLNCKNNETCTTCSSGYFNNNGFCISCGDGCINNMCTSTGCLECISGYFKDGPLCVKCPLNCSVCTSNGCTECLPNFQKTDGKCVECDLFCEDGECHQDGCHRCKSGYYINSTVSPKICLKCDAKCLTCNSFNLCLTCNSTYDKIEGMCCSKNCVECVVGSCVKCRTNYFLQNDGCEMCDTNCESGNCDTKSGCFFCKRGFYAINGFCKRCGDNCDDCHNEANCKKCSDEYEIVSGVCKEKNTKTTTIVVTVSVCVFVLILLCVVTLLCVVLLKCVKKNKVQKLVD
ncbi:hypothetical protein EIN_419410 [Entamoeba invadens IP1]|uniref:Uncharacterized protein n=1 Tax=Entamoeba invadens IP1 TaxID=370355 RepID=A0A0A1U580_ENTIV|nr:hypothetical protein EIN_419410 [Entamoeba invadens IP1]ELP88012.1 hypothetical protein EIN_419410 [Entamoeba invadens IP1]|eukprot:XP_004254783.1 hypothetical protein EIN_419410 [Entamoeba invadens IP1]